MIPTPAAVALVALGGAAGSALRETVALALPGAPLVATLVVNVLGALGLAVLLEALSGGGARGYEGRLGAARLLLGTGFCGGFTTYSAVAVQGAELLRGGDTVTAVAYAVVTLLLGAVATLGGILLGGRIGTGHGRAHAGPGRGAGA
ncbi:fluoride efflux transporter FluC [Dietzia sp. 179-F 9C3 NHS]|uniref:fluoride efflux transporter FluC n=1 Tax=Dietzia sp. 179-F 9C3 NHS TaxID=3374295 RepID=UPI00387A782D